MNRHIISLLTLCLCIGLSNIANAATYYKKPQYAVLMALDTKNKTIVVRNEIYKLRPGVKIHDEEKKLPGLSSLTVGNEIKFKTRKNRRTNQVEISEIWVLHM